MLIISALVKDIQRNVERFIDLNLRNGADGIVLFLDSGADRFTVPVQHRDHVVTVPMTRDWWRSAEPPPLNGRQRLVANMARVACARAEGVEWLFFIDGDEVALLDRDVLATVPQEIPAVRLSPRESVSDDSIDRSFFKRPLTDDELRHLVDLGLLARPRNARYFRGHLAGKAGVRPSAPVRFHVHTAVGPTGEDLPTFEHPSLRHLHFESPTLEEFVRKWSALAGSGSPPGVRGRRRALLDAFRDMHGLPDDVRQAREQALFDEHVREDGAGLRRAGVLEHVDLSETRAEPRPGAVESLRRIERELHLLSRLPKRLFLPSTPEKRLLAAIAAHSSPVSATR